MLELVNINKQYKNGSEVTVALKDINLTIRKNELTVILGPSGSGKSTTLNILGGMDNPSSGEVIYEGERIETSSLKALTSYRKNIVGFVFQFYNLISNLTVEENVAISARLRGKQFEKEVPNYMKQVDVYKRRNNFPDQLSGGEMQRVSIARALAKKPKLLLCDEPTGALDTQTSQRVFGILKKSVDAETAVVIVTHNPLVAGIANQVIKIKDGRIEETVENSNPLEVEEIDWE
ncbi:ABC transporter ATP-binding protein [Eupransor demetentiae]|uniref:ATPase component (LolD) n=1 Tax=Eupransor demetentiae TaxID=3109584 RepID=A0ABM9N445_9LACO|nr:ABC-type lipoprotein export system [Lactobacillaceae bacterium LMG 33000]